MSVKKYKPQIHQFYITHKTIHSISSWFIILLTYLFVRWPDHSRLHFTFLLLFPHSLLIWHCWYFPVRIIGTGEREREGGGEGKERERGDREKAKREKCVNLMRKTLEIPISCLCPMFWSQLSIGVRFSYYLSSATQRLYSAILFLMEIYTVRGRPYH